MHKNNHKLFFLPLDSSSTALDAASSDHVDGAHPRQEPPHPVRILLANLRPCSKLLNRLLDELLQVGELGVHRGDLLHRWLSAAGGGRILVVPERALQEVGRFLREGDGGARGDAPGCGGGKRVSSAPSVK